MSSERRLRLGILGAARNVPFSVLEPVRANADLSSRLHIVGIASLDQSDAESHAGRWDIPRAYRSFDEMLEDPDVDAVYNVLPTAVRCHWNVRALLAGKHVLSETPICSNAREALVAQRAAEDVGRVLLEGTHPTCHPVTKRVRQMIMEGKIGTLEHIDLNLPVNHGLQGRMVCSRTGALMSLGCHGIAIVRALTGEQPRVISAVAKPSRENPTVDATVSCNLRTPSGCVAHIGCSILEASSGEPTMFTISGAEGRIRVKEWFTGKGKSANEIELEQFAECGERFVERVRNAPTRDTFYFQWVGFVDEVREQERRSEVGFPWSYTRTRGPGDAVLNMSVIDAIYWSAEMAPWPTTAAPPEPYDRIGRSKL